MLAVDFQHQLEVLLTLIMSICAPVKQSIHLSISFPDTGDCVIL